MKKKLLLITTLFTRVLSTLKAQTFDPAWAARFQHAIDSIWPPFPFSGSENKFQS